MEYHPRVNVSDKTFSERKIILGSFPTWALTGPDLEKGERPEEKELERIKNEDINYFYGSSTNQFWHWYREYFDPTVSKDNILSIINSLAKHKIGITDVIYSCERKNRSALDKHLSNRVYNHSFFIYPNKGEKLKILCTSKGVMNEMLLNNKFFATHPQLIINETKSKDFESEILLQVGGSLGLIMKPFYRIIELKSGGIIECLTLPSPGSPYRRLKDFGINEQEPQAYLPLYLEKAFSWFKD